MANKTTTGAMTMRERLTLEQQMLKARIEADRLALLAKVQQLTATLHATERDLEALTNVDAVQHGYELPFYHHGVVLGSGAGIDTGVASLRTNIDRYITLSAVAASRD